MRREKGRVLLRAAVSPKWKCGSVLPGSGLP